MKSSLDKIFYKVVYHHIIYMCDFFLVYLDDFFAVVCMSFTKVAVSTIYVPQIKLNLTQYKPSYKK